MTDNKGFLGGIFDNCTILWFIILFLLLFWKCGCGVDDYDYIGETVGPGLTIE